ncbi:Ig-like domain-containing protein [Achromobacter sp. NPDC058515]|uniref:Ig-like domain-containing protein n=1 Tax=Achromobacter sp. NPDC058515 TaxID=3346533 RepID=UPI00365BD584
MKKTNWNPNFAVLSDKRSFQLQPLHALKDTLRVPAFEGGQYLFTEAAGTALPEDLTAARAGNDLYVSLRSAGWEKPVVIVEDFYAMQGEVYGMDGEGAYQRLLGADGASPQGPAMLAAERLGFWHQQQEAVALHHIKQSVHAQDTAQANPAAVPGEASDAVQSAATQAQPAMAMATALPASGDAQVASAAAPAFDDLPIAVTHIVDDVSTSGEVRELGANAIIDDNLPAIFGTGPAGAQLNILDGSAVIGSVTVGADGTWSFAPEIPFSEGGHILSARDAGSGAPPSSSFIFIVDTIAPGSTSIASVSENLLNPQGDQVPNGGSTKDNTPTLSGKSEPNSLVTIYNFGVPVASITSDVRTGAWSWKPMYPLPDGEYKFSARASDFVGNTGLSSKSYTIVVDTIPVPTAKVAFVGITDDTGSSATDYITSDSTLLVRVEVDRALNPGEVVQISMDNGASWSNAVQVGNHWVHDNTARALAEGERTLQARVVNTKGEVGPATSQDIVIDLTKPAHTVSITTYVDDAGESQGEFSFGAAPSTDDKSPLLKGTLDPALGNGERVAIYRDGEYLGLADVAGTTWKYQDAGLGDGRYVYTARVIDAAGNEGADSDPATLVREEMLTLHAADTVAHEAALQGGTGADWLFKNGSSTSDSTAGGGFTLGGTVTDVKFTLGGEAIDVPVSALAGNPTYTLGGDTLAITSHGNGKYSYTYTLNTPKSHDTSGGAVGEKIGNDLTIKASDANGKSVSETGRIEVVNDEIQASPDDFYVAKAEVPGVNITVAVDYSNSMASHFPELRAGLKGMLDSYGNAYAPGTPLTFTLFCWDGSGQPLLKTKTVDSLDAAKAWIDQALSAGTSAFNPNWTDGVNLIQDAVQKSMDLHPDWNQKVYFISDGSPGSGQMTPAMLETPQSWKDFISGANTDIIDVYGIGFESGQRHDAVQKVLNPNDAGDKYYAVTNDGALAAILGSTVVTEGNLFDSPNPIGEHQSVVLGADGGFILGSVRVGSTAYAFGASDSVSVALQDGGSMEIFKDGTFKLTLPSGAANFTVPMTFELRDADGDTATIAKTLRFGTFSVTIEKAIDDYGLVTGPVANHGATDDTTPTLVGRALPYKLVTISEGSTVLGSAMADENGNWSYTPPEQDEGTHVYTATSSDLDGGSSSWNFTLTIDLTPPGAVASVDGYFDDSGVSQGDFTFAAAPSTDDTSPKLKGTLSQGLDAGDRVAVYRDGAYLGDAVVNGEDWEFQDDGLGTGSYTYTARVIDAVGNKGGISDPATLIREDMLTLAATDTAVHEAALANGTGIDWAANDGSTTSDRIAGGDFTLGGDVTEVTFRLGGEERTVSVGELARNPAYKLGGDTLAIASHGDGKYSYTYTLDTPKAHDTSGGAAGETVRNDLTITARDANGKSVSETGRIEVVNDELRASPGEFLIGDIEAPVAGVNLTLVLDKSGSMLNMGNTPQGMQTKWDVQIKAVHELLDKYADVYAAGTAFNVDIVVFSWTVEYSRSFASFEEAKAWLRTITYLDPQATTNYDAALTEAQRLIRHSFDVRPGWEQKVYFLTDGEPNSGVVPQGWIDFVNGRYKDLVDVYGVGIHEAAASASEYIKAALGPGDEYLSVADPADLAAALKNTVAVEGNLFGADGSLGYQQTIALGGDGGFKLLKVTVGGTEYVLGASPVTIQIEPGLSMQIAADGNFKVESDGPLPDLPVAVTFEVVDADGDRHTLAETLHLGKTSSLKIESFEDDAGAVHGVLGNGAKTDDASPLLKGSLADSLQAGQRVDIYEDGRLVGTATVTGRDWRFQLEDVAAGKHSYTAVLVDGNGAGLEMSRQFLIDVNRDPALAIDGFGDQAAAKTYSMADGSYWMFYASDEGQVFDYRLYAQHFSADGKALGERAAIAQGAAAGDRYIGYSAEKGQQYVANYDVSFKPDGSFMVAYATNGGDAKLSNGGGQKVYLSSFDASGNFIEDLAVNRRSSVELTPKLVTMGDGSFVLLYTGGSINPGDHIGAGIPMRQHFQRFAADGSPIDAVAWVLGDNFSGGYVDYYPYLPSGAISDKTGTDSFGAVALDADSFGVVQGRSGLGGVPDVVFHARKFSTGAAIGSAQLLNTQTSGFQIGVQMIGLKGGGYVAVWASNHTAGGAPGTPAPGSMDEFNVYSRTFDWNGSALVPRSGPEAMVNTSTDGVNGVSFDRLSVQLDVVALETGGYAVVWARSTGFNTADIYGQTFDAAGNRVGGETLISANTASSPDLMPTVMALDDGGYRVSWVHSDPLYDRADFNGDVYTSVVDANGNLVQAALDAADPEQADSTLGLRIEDLLADGQTDLLLDDEEVQAVADKPDGEAAQAALDDWIAQVDAPVETAAADAHRDAAASLRMPIEEQEAVGLM